MAHNIKFDLVRKKALANILAKVKDGKTLTAAEQRTLDDEERRSKGMRENRTAEAMAIEYSVTRQTIVRWGNMKAPFDNDFEFWCWMVKNRIKGGSDWRSNYESTNAAECKKWRDENFKQKRKTIPRCTKSVEELRDEYLAELQDARDKGDEDREKVALNAYLKIDKQIRDTALDEKKLGIEKGEMLARSEVERILENICWAGNASCDKFGKQIAERLSNKAPADIYRILAPLLTALMIFEPVRKLKTAPGNINLPEWVIECFETERKQYLK